MSVRFICTEVEFFLITKVQHCVDDEDATNSNRDVECNGSRNVHQLIPHRAGVYEVQDGSINVKVTVVMHFDFCGKFELSLNMVYFI